MINYFLLSLDAGARSVKAFDKFASLNLDSGASFAIIKAHITIASKSPAFEKVFIHFSWLFQSDVAEGEFCISRQVSSCSDDQHVADERASASRVAGVINVRR